MTKKISFKNSKGLKLAGVLHLSDKNSNRAVIIAHGFTSNKDRERFREIAEVLAKNGITALRIDFGGSGESGDRPITVIEQIDDLLSAVEFLNSKGYSRVGVLGESLGGLVTLRAYGDNFKSMVLWAPVTKARLSDLSQEQSEELKSKGFYTKKKEGKNFIVPQEYIDERLSVDRNSLLKKVNIPVLIVHGTADKTIPIQDSKEAVSMLPEGSKLVAIEGWEHGDDPMNSKMDQIIPTTVKWFDENI